ncbi:transcriptional regulator [Streptomyces massasporeus]
MTAVDKAGTRTVPTQLAALAAGVSEATIRQWATRGKLTRYGRPGRREYSLQELTALIAKNTPHTQSAQHAEHAKSAE